MPFPLNLGEYPILSVREMHVYKLTHARVEVDNTDLRIVHGYLYIVKGLG